MNESSKKLLRDYGLTVVIAVLVAVLIRVYLIEAYRIPSGSMRPTLEAGDTVFVKKSDYKIFGASPVRGDVIVFTDSANSKRDYIKRVVGIAGETVQLKDGKITIDGKAATITKLPDSDPSSKTCAKEWLIDQSSTHGVCWEPPLLEDTSPEKVPPGSVYVLGDTRSQSPADIGKHKTWGIVPISSIQGKAAWIWMSVEPSAVRGWFPMFRFNRMMTRIN